MSERSEAAMLIPDDIKAEVHAIDGYVSDAYLEAEATDGTRVGEWKHTGTPLFARWVEERDRWEEVRG